MGYKIENSSKNGLLTIIVTVCAALLIVGGIGAAYMYFTNSPDVVNPPADGVVVDSPEKEMADDATEHRVLRPVIPGDAKSPDDETVDETPENSDSNNKDESVTDPPGADDSKNEEPKDDSDKRETDGNE